MKHLFSLNVYFAVKRFLFTGILYSFCYSLIFTSYSFGQYDPNPTAIQEVAAGLRDSANAIWWGFDPVNVTSKLQAALNSRATKLFIPNVGKPWIVDPLLLSSNKNITLESGVILQARKGSFLGDADCLLNANDKHDITITGYGAQVVMNKDDYLAPPYSQGQWRHCVSLLSSSNIKIYGLRFAKSGGDGIYIGRSSSTNTIPTNIEIKSVTCDSNYRQGITVISAQNLFIENCVVTNTKGIAPEAGIDFEPNNSDDVLINCNLKKCTFSGNNTYGVIVSLIAYTQSSTPASVNIDSCISQNNAVGAFCVWGPVTPVPYLGYVVTYNNQFIGTQWLYRATGIDVLYNYPTTYPIIGISDSFLAFGDVIVNTASSEKTLTYIVQGSNLSPTSGNITITPPSGYQVSATSGSEFGSSLNVSYTSGKLSSKTIYVKFSPTAAQSYTGNITIAGGGATTKNIAVTGTGVSATTPTLTASNAALEFGDIAVNTTRLSSTNVSGLCLSPAAGNITVTAPTGYTVSQTYGSGYASSITCAYTGNTLSTRTIYVRFSPTAVQSYTGNIAISGGGATTKNIAVTGTGVSTTTPTLTASNASLSFGNIFVDSIRLSSFTISGSNLSPAAGNITVTAPAGYTVSQTYGNGYASSITCAYTSNTLSARAIYVRFSPTAAQSYTGNITIAGGGATTKTVALTGTGVPTSTRMLVTNQTSLSFGNVIINTISGEQIYTLTGLNLSPASGSLTITAPSGFTISTVSGSDFTSSKTIAYTGGALSAKVIYVKFSPTTAQSYTGNITNSGGGATTQNVALNGTGIGIASPEISINPSSLEFSTVRIGTNSSERIYTLQGSYLSPASGNINITPPSGYQVSVISGSGFSSSLNVSYTGSTLSSKTIYVRFSPTAEQIYTGNITNAGGGAPTQSVAVSGTGVSATSAALTVSPTSLSFGDVIINTTSREKTYNLTGLNLLPASDSITITATDGFTISTESGSGFTSSKRIAYAGGMLQPIPKIIYIRFSPASEQSYYGIITNSGGASAAQTIAISGKGIIPPPPTLMVNPTSLSFGNVANNTISSERTYILTGSNLSPASGSISLTAPTGFQVSSTTGSGFDSSITISYTGGVLYDKTIYGRFLPTLLQSYSGSIMHTGGGAADATVSVSGSGAVPTITVNPVSLPFSSVIINTTSSERTFTLFASDLTPASGNITVTAPSTAFQVSLTTGSGFSSSVSVSYSGGAISSPVTIFVRFLPTAEQNYSGNISNTGGGAAAQDLSVSGIGISATAPIITINPTSLLFDNVPINTVSTRKTYTLSGSNLSPASGYDTVKAPTGFQVSTTSGSGFDSSLTIAYNGGTLAATTIYVIFCPTTAQNYFGNISNTGGGAAAESVYVSGSIVSPVLVMSLDSLTFGSVTINTSTMKTYTLFGMNLQPANDTLKIIVPIGFTISTKSDSGFYSSIDIPYTAGTLSSTTIYVQFSPVAEQSYSGNITHSCGGIAMQDLPISGESVVPSLTVSSSSITFGYVPVNTSSTELTYKINGSNLTPASGNVIVTAPSGFEASITSSSGFNSSINIPYTAGDLSSTVIYLRFSPIAVQSYIGNISNDGGGATTRNVTVSGTGVNAPIFSISPTSLSFGYVSVSVISNEKFYTLSCADLIPGGNITITSPKGFQVSATNGAGFDTSISIPVSYGTDTLSSRSIYVRFSPTVAENYSGNITNAGGGAPEFNVAVSGIGLPLNEVVQLGQNFPNPFNPTTRIPYTVYIKSRVRLTIYNILGQRIQTLIDEEQDVGYYQPEFDISRSNNNVELASGIYFYRLEIAGKSATKKLILLK